MCDQHSVFEEILCASGQPFCTRDLSSRTGMEGHSTDAERGLGLPGAGDGGTILAATQARHWCEIVIGLSFL